jgi:hypothetical protein
MTTARAGHVAVLLLDGRVFVIGGVGTGWTFLSSAEIYDPRPGRFTATGGMSVPRESHPAVRLRDGRVLITGGADERDNEGIYAGAEVYDPRTGTFNAIDRMRAGRYKHRGTSVLLPNGTVLLAGGATQVEVFDPASGRFTIVGGDARMAGQFSASAALSGGRVLITGGYGQGSGPRPGAWIYEP